MVAPLTTPPEMAGEPEAYARVHARSYGRDLRRLPVTVALVDRDGNRLADGRAELVNLTPVGAWLARLDLGAGSLPVGDFRVVLRVTDGPHAGVEAVARPVRARWGKQSGLGIAFQHLRVTA